jgi:glucose/arabinose dehydrogenase
MAFLTSNTFGSWKGSVLCGGLAAQRLYRCTFEGTRLTSMETVNGVTGRVRNVIQGPDGAVYASLENPGRIIRIKAN